jgi:hypothetical protein
MPRLHAANAPPYALGLLRSAVRRRVPDPGNNFTARTARQSSPEVW